ncbi:hypothetical protein GQ651_08535 [Alphaproteobacteria bacterium GH1-50]|uniref:Uncharacterized protein n=1 Tax=Kangsaoukella pontilimi TaxID=2691042 RepID=A0A7C9MCY4_9RHOB|nr:DUF5906 domain-containing protein [Kangsaoukella pontilimi]MXQ07891.1 hypothetical protein [Kangsaoukella pontilimi]
MPHHDTQDQKTREPSKAPAETAFPENFETTLTNLWEASEDRFLEPAFVLLRDKRAFRKNWPNLRPTLEEVLRHLRNSAANSVGIQPGSLGCVVFDCDEGDGPEAAAEALREAHGDVVACVTPSTSGAKNKGHVWVRCDDPAAVGNWKFRTGYFLEGEAHGDLRSWGGQVRLNQNSAALILEHVIEGASGDVMTAADLAAYRTSSTAERDPAFDRTEGRVPDWHGADAALWPWLEQRLIEDPDDRSAEFFAVVGRMKMNGLSFDACLETLEPYTSAWTKNGAADGKYQGQALKDALEKAWTKLPARPSPAEDFEDDADVIETDDEDPSPTGVLRNWVWVADASRFIRRSDLKQFNKDQWNSLFADLEPEGSLLNKVWRSKTPVRRFESLAYIPGKPELIGDSTYNIWRPSRIEPAEGDVSVIEEHLAYLLPDPVERGHLIDFMHFACVKPEVKIHFALLLQGMQGTGKTAVGTLMKRIVGTANVAEPSPDELKSQWTKWQEGASLALVEELMMNGRLELANKLKPVITNETLRIEDKGAPLYSIPNHLNMLCFTNHENAVRLEEGDRRWLVLFSPAEPRDDAYYSRLFDFIEGDGPARWLRRLQAHEPALNPKGRAPETAAKAAMREASLTDVESTVREWMASGTGPMANDLFRFDDAWGMLSGRSHKSNLTLALKAVGCVKHTRQTNEGLPKVVVWSCRNHEKWENAGPTERTRAWMEMEGYDTLADFQAVN